MLTRVVFMIYIPWLILFTAIMIMYASSGPLLLIIYYYFLCVVLFFDSHKYYIQYLMCKLAHIPYCYGLSIFYDLCFNYSLEGGEVFLVYNWVEG